MQSSKESESRRARANRSAVRPARGNRPASHDRASSSTVSPKKDIRIRKRRLGTMPETSVIFLDGASSSDTSVPPAEESARLIKTALARQPGRSQHHRNACLICPEPESGTASGGPPASGCR